MREEQILMFLIETPQEFYQQVADHIRMMSHYLQSL